MRFNTLKPAPGAKKAAKRVGRGGGSGLGKTCGRGHKGQRARAGGYHKVGFEGGQMPLQRRLPKFGFNSAKSKLTAQLRVAELMKVSETSINLDTLKAAGLIAKHITHVKVFLSGKLTKAVQLSGISVSAGAKLAIESAGGRVEA